MKSLAEVIEQEKEYRAMKSDRLMTPDKFWFGWEAEGVPALMHQRTKKSYTLTDNAIRNLCQKFKFDIELLEHLSPKTVEYCFNQLFRAEKFARKDYRYRFVNTEEGPVIRAVLGKDYQPCDNLTMLNLVYETLKDHDIKVFKSHHTPDELFLRLVDGDFTAHNTGEDLGKAFTFGTNELGLSSAWGMIGMIVHACTNGMLGINPEDSFRLPHVNHANGDTPQEALSRLLTHAEDSWDRIATDYKKVAELKVLEPLKFVQKVNEDYSLGKRASKKVLDYYEVNYSVANATMKDIVDCYTEYAHKFFEINSQNHEIMERIGSELLSAKQVQV
jgi:hypothetical protein